MNTLLLAWNPKKWSWSDLSDDIARLKSGGIYPAQWSCGNSKSVRKGDRFFLIRLGKHPRGIMGSGYTTSSSRLSDHWDGTPGKTTNFIDIEFDILVDPDKNDLFGLELLREVDPKSLQLWFPQQSGISIRSELLEALEERWFNFISEKGYIGGGFVSDDVINDTPLTFMEGKSRDVIQTRFERNPQARKVCLNHHGYSCKICDFNFEDTFGETGRGFIHVHHLNPIAAIRQEYKLDPKNDLVPVCPNCHSMIHSRRPPFSIEEIIGIRNNKRIDTSSIT